MKMLRLYSIQVAKWWTWELNSCLSALKVPVYSMLPRDFQNLLYKNGMLFIMFYSLLFSYNTFPPHYLTYCYVTFWTVLNLSYGWTIIYPTNPQLLDI